MKLLNTVFDLVIEQGWTNSVNEELDERSRSFAFTRKKLRFSEPAKRYAKNRFRFADRKLEEQGWSDPIKAASGPQKCGLTKGSDNGSYEKECRALDKEAARQDKIDQKERALADKNFMSLSYDRDSFPLDRQSKKDYYNQYQNFMKENPGVLTDGDGFNSEQKYAIVSKVLDFVRKVPKISYTIQLNRKYGLTPQSSLNDVIGVVNKMGGFGSFMNWFNSGGRELK